MSLVIFSKGIGIVRTGHASDFVPTQFVKRFAPRIAKSAGGLPIADVGCGSGRNASVFLNLGCKVICLDKDLSQLKLRNVLQSFPHNIEAVQVDFLSETWPLKTASVGGIINVHFLLPTLFRSFTRSLIPGGYLLIQTVPGCGGNYLQLPKPNELRTVFSEHYELEFYQEGLVGPPSCK